MSRLELFTPSKDQLMVESLYKNLEQRIVAFDEKYGFRDYRGGGRSSGRETIGRVAAGAIAAKLLESLGITVQAYTSAVGPVKIDHSHMDMEEISKNRLYMPDKAAAAEAESYMEDMMQRRDS